METERTQKRIQKIVHDKRQCGVFGRTEVESFTEMLSPKVTVTEGISIMSGKS